MKNSAMYASGFPISLYLFKAKSRSGAGFNVVRIKNFRLTIFLLFFMLVGAPAYSANLCIWVGESNSDWFNPLNWFGGVPNADDQVRMWDGPNGPVNDPVIGSAGAVAGWIQIEAMDVLTITAAGTLTLNAPADGNIFNYGTVHNHGTITINMSAIGDIGINNIGTFHNYADGKITINRQLFAGFQNWGTFTNAGILNIGTMNFAGNSGILNFGSFSNLTGGQITIDYSTITGLVNKGTFTNDASITIGGVASPGGFGLINEGTFNNNANGEIKIDRSTNTGLSQNTFAFQNAGSIIIGGIASPGNTGLKNDAIFINNTGGQVMIDRSTYAGLSTNNGVLTNNASITIGSAAGPGLYGIRNTAAFNNNAGGEIQIDRSTEAGIFHLLAAFTNAGVLTIGSLASPGEVGIEITTNGTFINLEGGEIGIDRSTAIGIYNLSGATFTNKSDVAIGKLAGVEGFGISNVAAINNNACAKIEMYRSLFNWGSVNNAGLLSINSAYPQTNTGTVVNDGIIEYRQGVTIPNVTNNDLIIQDISGSCSAYSPALQIGGANSFTPASTWYKDAAQTLIAGTYNLATNTFTPANLSGNSPIPLYFNITDNANGCTQAVTLDYTVANDVTPPTVVCKNATLNLDLGGNGNLTTAMVFQSGSDNCGTVNQQSVSPNTFDCGDIGAQTVTLTVNDGNGNTATCSATVTVADNTPPMILCSNATVFLDATGMASIAPGAILLLASDNCGTVNPASILPNTFTCANVGGLTFVSILVTDSRGNASTCNVFVEVLDNLGPALVCKNATVNLNAAGSATITTASVFQSGSDNCGTVNLVSVLPNSFNCNNIGANTVTLTANDGNGHLGTCSATVTVTETSAPAVVCKNAAVNLDAAGSAAITTAMVFQSGSDNCGTVNQQSVSPNTFNCSNIGANTVTLMVNDGSGNTGTCTATVTVTDNIAPTVVCKNATVSLNAAGSAGLAASAVFQSGADNCGVVNQVSVTPGTFTCVNIGANPVTLLVNDGHGNTATCTATVTVVDITGPTVVCKNITVNLDAAGSAGITAGAVFQSGSDNCGAVTQQSVAPSTFTCANIGANTVTLTANDGYGNTGTCTATVTVTDNIAPTVVCKNATVSLNAAGSASLATSAVFQSGADNCGVVNQVSVTPGTFTCANIGANTVTLLVNDGHGNTATCTATVTVADITGPTVVCKNITVNLDAAGSAAVTTGSVFQSGSDNCGTVNLQSVSPNTFTCANIGANNVILTANDGHGNTSTCTATVTVADAISPTMLCQNVTVNLDPGGQAVITPAQVNNGSFDNCTITSTSLSATTFNCSNLGNNAVELIGLDQSGNKGVCSAVITVKDVTAPVAKCKNLTANLGANGSVTVAASALNNGSTDNCGFTLTVTPATFNCGNIGANTVTLKATDNGGNTATCTAVVTVKDVTAPTAICKNPIIYLDETGHATITPAAVNNNSYDACGIATMTINNNQFDCSHTSASPVSVVLTLKDVYNNTSSCIASVYVKDAIAPNAICENTSVQLGPNGLVVVTGQSLAQDSYDNCSVWSYSPVAKVYTTANIGVNNLTVTVKDWSGNASTCIAQVTVQPYGANAMPIHNNQSTDSQIDPEAVDRSQDPYESSLGLTLFPNPAIEYVTLRFHLRADTDFQLKVFNMTGRLVVEQAGKGSAGNNHLPIDLAKLDAGLYLVEVRSGVFREQRRLVVVRE